MPATPIFTIPTSEVKMKWKETYLTEGLNEHLSGGVSFGIYRGFRLGTSGGALEVTVSADPDWGDHVAYVRTVDVSTEYMLRVRRAVSSFTLDLSAFTNQTVVIVLYGSYVQGSDTAADIRVFTVADFLAEPDYEFLTVIGTVVVPAAGVIPAGNITHARRTDAWSTRSPGAVPPRRVLRNSSFEWGKTGLTTSRIPFWTVEVVSDITTTNCARITASDGYSDSRSLEILSNAEGVSGSIGQIISAPVTANTEVFLKFRVKRVSGALTAGSITASISFGDSSGAIATTVSRTITTEIGTGSWTDVELWAKAPAGTNYVDNATIEVSGVTVAVADGTPILRFDDVQLLASDFMPDRGEDSSVSWNKETWTNGLFLHAGDFSPTQAFGGLGYSANYNGFGAAFIASAADGTINSGPALVSRALLIQDQTSSKGCWLTFNPALYGARGAITVKDFSNAVSGAPTWEFPQVKIYQLDTTTPKLYLQSASDDGNLHIEAEGGTAGTPHVRFYTFANGAFSWIGNASYDPGTFTYTRDQNSPTIEVASTGSAFLVRSFYSAGTPSWVAGDWVAPSGRSLLYLATDTAYLGAAQDGTQLLSISRTAKTATFMQSIISGNGLQANATDCLVPRFVANGSTNTVQVWNFSRADNSKAVRAFVDPNGHFYQVVNATFTAGNFVQVDAATSSYSWSMRQSTGIKIGFKASGSGSGAFTETIFFEPEARYVEVDEGRVRLPAAAISAGSNPAAGDIPDANTLYASNTPKAWGRAQAPASPGTATIHDGFNIASITTETNKFVVTLTTPMHDMNYFVVANVFGLDKVVMTSVQIVSGSQFKILVFNNLGAVDIGADTTEIGFMVMGKQLG